MKNELEIAVINGGRTPQIKALYKRHNQEGIPYVELRKGKKYGEIWFETPCDIPFKPEPLFHLREWYESYWLQRKENKGLQPYRFSMGPTALWFKFTLSDLDVVKKMLTTLTWERASAQDRKLPAIRASSDRLFWKYAERYFERSQKMKRKIGQKVRIS